MRALSITAAAHLAKWDGVAAHPRDAATVLVTRPAGAGIEVLLLRRRPSLQFAAGMHVFPGGTLSDGDRAAVPWIGPDARAWAARWHCEPELAGALVVAAVRETFEETGILLAGADERSVVGAVDGPEWRAARRRLEDGELTLGAFLRDRELALRADLMGAWGHWITPAFEPRRFDTRFFVAVLPEGQEHAPHGMEADSSFWIDPADALRAGESAELAMMAPTLHNLRDLVRADAATLLTSTPLISPIEPRLIVVDGQPMLTTESDAATA